MEGVICGLLQVGTCNFTFSHNWKTALQEH